MIGNLSTILHVVTQHWRGSVITSPDDQDHLTITRITDRRSWIKGGGFLVDCGGGRSAPGVAAACWAGIA